jgi:hypothetical protein
LVWGIAGMIPTGEHRNPKAKLAAASVLCWPGKQLLVLYRTMPLVPSKHCWLLIICWLLHSFRSPMHLHLPSYFRSSSEAGWKHAWHHRTVCSLWNTAAVVLYKHLDCWPTAGVCFATG